VASLLPLGGDERFKDGWFPDEDFGFFVVAGLNQSEILWLFLTIVFKSEFRRRMCKGCLSVFLLFVVGFFFSLKKCVNFESFSFLLSLSLIVGKSRLTVGKGISSLRYSSSSHDSSALRVTSLSSSRTVSVSVTDNDRVFPSVALSVDIISETDRVLLRSIRTRSLSVGEDLTLIVSSENVSLSIRLR